MTRSTLHKVKTYLEAIERAQSLTVAQRDAKLALRLIRKEVK